MNTFYYESKSINLGVHVMVVGCERAAIKGGHVEVLNGKNNSLES